MAQTHPTAVSGGPSGLGRTACQTSARHGHGTSVVERDVSENAAIPETGSLHGIDALGSHPTVRQAHSYSIVKEAS